jgi:hypothetical protein
VEGNLSTDLVCENFCLFDPVGSGSNSRKFFVGASPSVFFFLFFSFLFWDLKMKCRAVSAAPAALPLLLCHTVVSHSTEIAVVHPEHCG